MRRLSKRERAVVIIIHEMLGITPLVGAFAHRVADQGMTAVLPNLFGTPGKPVTIPYVLSSLARVCVSKEFTLLALNRTSPIVDYLRELANHEHEACGGPGVGHRAKIVSYVESIWQLDTCIQRLETPGEIWPFLSHGRSTGTSMTRCSPTTKR
jgi:hypothetical protein